MSGTTPPRSNPPRSNPPRTIVVGVDESPEATEALDWARSFAGPTDKIIVVLAWRVPLLVSAYAPEAALPSEFQRLAVDSLARILADVDDDRLVPMVRQGRPGPTILDEATDADLVVVGHRGVSRASMMLGSTANHVLHHATAPTVVVRGDPGRQPRRVVVGVDAHDVTDPGTTNESVRALRWALELPGVERVDVIHGWFLPPLAIGMYADPRLDIDLLEKSAAQAIDLVIDAAGAVPDGVAVNRRVVRNPGAVALIDASKDADLVVVGSRGRGGFSGLLLGSTSAEVAAHSHAPVAVIR